MNTTKRCPLHCIVPPYLFEKMMESTDPGTRQAAFDTLMSDSRVRGIREARSYGDRKSVV